MAPFIYFLSHLGLDVPRGLLYWLDQGTKTISRVNLEGHHRKTVVESNGYLDRPFGLAVFEVKASFFPFSFCFKMEMSFGLRALYSFQIKRNIVACVHAL